MRSKGPAKRIIGCLIAAIAGGLVVMAQEKGGAEVTGPYQVRRELAAAGA